MKKIIFSVLCFTVLSISLLAQSVGVNTTSPDPSSALDITATNRGLLIPRMPTTAREQIIAPASGLLVYDTTTETFWYFDGMEMVWVELLAGNQERILDEDEDTRVHTDETLTDEDMIRFYVDGEQRMFLDGKTLHLNAPGNSVFLGAGAGELDDGNNRLNIYVGYEAGKNNVMGFRNLGIGYQALFNNTANNNVALGHVALNQNITGFSNSAVGSFSLWQNNSGSSNVAVGVNSLYDNQSGNNNVAIGAGALGDVVSTSDNTALGNNAARQNTGSSNTIIGSGAGFNNVAGSGNIFLGYQAGFDELGSNKLYIDNSSTTIPLIYGDFASNQLGVNRIPTSNTFEVSGNASKASAGEWLTNSDARLKKNIQILSPEEALGKLMQLNGVTYEWDDDKTGYERPLGICYGFTAQNIQAVFPDLVTEDAQGYLQTTYGTYDAMQIEAIRALLKRIETLEAENSAHIDRNKDLEARLVQLEAIVSTLSSK